MFTQTYLKKYVATFGKKSSRSPKQDFIVKSYKKFTETISEWKKALKHDVVESSVKLIYDALRNSDLKNLARILDDLSEYRKEIFAEICRKPYAINDSYTLLVSKHLKRYTFYPDIVLQMNGNLHVIYDFYQTYTKALDRQNLIAKRKEEPKKTAFDILRANEFDLDWRWCRFESGAFTVYCPDGIRLKFSPLKKRVQYCLASFNYIKDYLNERMPKIKCRAEKGQLTILTPITFDKAILKMAYDVGRQHGMAMEIDDDVTKKNNRSRTPTRTSFQTSLSRVVTEQELRSIKSPYINHLIALQEKAYRIIPCVEALTHKSSDKLEPAFMFTIKFNGALFIAFENINLARSTYLFKIKNSDIYMQAARAIHEFMQGPEINKRSYLRSGFVKMSASGIIGFDCVDHDETYQWKRLLASKARCMYP